MPKALVSMAVAQIAPGTIRQGVRLNDDDVPLSGYPGRRAGLPCAALASAKLKPPSSSCAPKAHRNLMRTGTPMLETLAQTRRQNDVDENPDRADRGRSKYLEGASP